jgi:hypothetical protein
MTSAEFLLLFLLYMAVGVGIGYLIGNRDR